MVFADLLGVRLHRIPSVQAIQTSVDFLTSDTAHFIATVNPEFLIAGLTHPWFREMLNRADLALVDGIGIAWAYEFFDHLPKWIPFMPKKFYRTWLTRWIWARSFLVFLLSSCTRRRRHQQRLSGSDFIIPLLQQLPSGTRIYLLGGEGRVAERVQTILQKKFLNLRFVGAEEGLRRIRITSDGISLSTQDDEQLCERIRRQEPAVIFVAFGQMKQEAWIMQHLFHFPTTRLFMGVGGSFDFMSGVVRRAPVFVRSMGLEWLWRLILQPWRMGRIWTAVVRFPLAVLAQAYQEIELMASGTNQT